MLYIKNSNWLKIRKQKDRRSRKVLEKLWLIDLIINKVTKCS